MVCTTRCAAAIGVIMLAGQVMLVARTTAPGSVEFLPGRQGRVVLPVTIGGLGPFRFLLDTGSSRSAISTRVAARLRARMSGGTLMMTPGGNAPRSITALEGLQIGTLVVSRVSAVVLPHDSMPGGGSVEGLIGQDVLSLVTYTIDYDRRLLEWGTGGGPADGSHIPLVYSNGVYFMTATTPGRSERLTLLADSGADAIVLFAHERTNTFAGTATRGQGWLRTSTGLTTGREVSLGRLAVGGVTLRDQRALVVPDRSERLMGDGLLPLHVFSRVTVDASNRSLVVWAR